MGTLFKARKSIKRKSLLSITAVFLILSFSSIASANLLVNSGLETGDLTGWVAEGNDTTVATQNPRSGSYHGRNTWDGAWDGVNNAWHTSIYQDVSIVGGQQYRLSGNVFFPSGSSPAPDAWIWDAMIQLEMYSSEGFLVFASNNYLGFLGNPVRDQYNLIDSSPPEWITAPSHAATARVRFSSWAFSPYEPASPIDFDDFDFSPIPEPASLLTLGFGLLGWGCLRREEWTS